MDFLRFSASNAPIRLIRVPLRGHAPRRWHSGPLYENVKKKDGPVLQQKPSEEQSPESPVKRPTNQPMLIQSNTPPTQSPSNPHRDFYRSWSAPIIKVALGAMLTYQAVYWSWLKLESIEQEKDGNEKLTGLKRQLVEAARERRPGG